MPSPIPPPEFYNGYSVSGDRLRRARGAFPEVFGDVSPRPRPRRLLATAGRGVERRAGRLDFCGRARRRGRFGQRRRAANALPRGGGDELPEPRHVRPDDPPRIRSGSRGGGSLRAVRRSAALGEPRRIGRAPGGVRRRALSLPRVNAPCRGTSSGGDLGGSTVPAVCASGRKTDSETGGSPSTIETGAGQRSDWLIASVLHQFAGDSASRTLQTSGTLHGSAPN